MPPINLLPNDSTANTHPPTAVLSLPSQDSPQLIPPQKAPFPCSKAPVRRYDDAFSINPTIPPIPSSTAVVCSVPDAMLSVRSLYHYRARLKHPCTWPSDCLPLPSTGSLLPLLRLAAACPLSTAGGRWGTGRRRSSPRRCSRSCARAACCRCPAGTAPSTSWTWRPASRPCSSTPSSTSCCSCSSSSSCSLTSTSDVSVFPTPSHKLLACFSFFFLGMQFWALLIAL